MGTLKTKYSKFIPPENAKEVFLAEALGHAIAEDVMSPAENKIILPKGRVITPRRIGDLAAQGIDRVFVYRKPRISLIVIGSGLAPPGIPKGSGRTYDFSIAALKAALETMRIRPVFVRRLKSEPKILKKMIPFAFNQSDMVILVIKEAGQGFAQIQQLLKGLPDQNKKPIFCLAYDPDLIFESFYRFIQPAIRTFMGVSS